MANKSRLNEAVLGGFVGLVLLLPLRSFGDDVRSDLSPESVPVEPVPQPTFFQRLFGIEPRPTPVPQIVPGKRHLVVVCGLTGGDEYRDRFTQTTLTLIDALTTRGEFDKGLVQVYLGDDDMAADPELASLVSGTATGETLQQLADSLVETIEPADTLWLFALGHTYFDGRRVWYNLPGKDVDEQTFGRWFSAVGGRESVFWLTMPTSGFFIKPLSQPGRIVISATEADREVIATEFPHQLAEVLSSPLPEDQHDQDGDGRVSLFDLYLVTARRVAQSFRERELVATEHAHLDDNGDRRGSEIQRSYLPVELEGTLAESDSPRPRTGDGEGAAAAAVLLPPGLLMLPEPEAEPAGESETGEEPAVDSETGEEPSALGV